MNATATVILGSAAIGALVSSVITFAGQHIERRARRSEILLTESVKLAMAHKDTLIKVAEMSKREMFIPEQALLVQTYYVALSRLIEDGHLPKGLLTTDSPEDIEAFAREHRRR